MAQRMFCCRNPQDARRAIICSAVAQVVTIIVALVGVGLFVYYQHHQPSASAQALLANRADGDRIFPVFVVEIVPVGLKGLIIAAIFAAAISSVMGILTALSQTMMAAFYHPLRERLRRRRGITATSAGAGAGPSDENVSDSEHRRNVLVSRLLVVLSGVALSLLAYGSQYAAAKYKALLDLGLALAGYTGGGLLAGFVLSFLPLRVDGRGYLWSAPLSVLTIFALAWHRNRAEPWYADWSLVTCLVAAGGLLLTWLIFVVWRRPALADSRRPVLPGSVQTLLLILALAGVIGLNLYGHWGEGPPDRFGNPTFRNLAWPWYVPIGSLVAGVWGYLLACRKTETQGVDLTRIR